MTNIIAEKGIKSGTLRRAYNDALGQKIVCRNQLLISLAAMSKKGYPDDAKIKLAQILINNKYSQEYIRKILSQITVEYYPTKKQIDELLSIIEDDYQYEDGFIKDILLKSVNIEELTQYQSRPKKKKHPLAAEIKNYLYENDLIEAVLEAIGCHNIEVNAFATEYRCSNYDGDNASAIRVKNTPYIDVTNFTRTQYFRENSDIIDLIKYNLDCDFNGAMNFLYAFIANSNGNADDKVPNTTKPHTKETSEKNIESKISGIKSRSESDLDLYLPLLYIEWHREGIMPWTRKKFDIRYSFRENSIIIPLRKWDDGTLLAFNKRTTIEHAEELDFPKYHIDAGYPKMKNIYGLWENRKFIEEKGYCILFEGAKSTLKRDSFNDPTGLSLLGKHISEEQVNIILSLNISEVIIALDEDVSIDEVRFMAEKFYGKIKVSYMYNTHGLLAPKQSPADLKNADYLFMFNNRILYDEEEHEKLLESMQKK